PVASGGLHGGHRPARGRPPRRTGQRAGRLRGLRALGLRPVPAAAAPRRGARGGGDDARPDLIGLAFAHAVMLRDLPHGDGIVIDVLIGTFIGDTGAYLGGRTFGTRRLAPTISPNKTLEGLAIGFVIAIAAVWLAGLYQDWLSGWHALILGAAV